MKEAPREVCVIGAGGHGAVMVALLQALGFKLRCVLDDAPEKRGLDVLGVPVEVPVSTTLRTLGKIPVVIAVGDNPTRRRIAERFPGTRWLTAVHPWAYVHESVRLGPGAVVFAGAVIQPRAQLGSHVIINTGATVDHDCQIGDFVHIAPGSHLAGSVTVGEGSLLGTGTAVITGKRIGARCRVGAGSVVIDDLPAGVYAVGTPARPQSRPRALTDTREA